MKNKEFGKVLEIRTKNFALQIIKVSKLLPNTIENRVIKNQLVKSGTSIGANYREANKARSKADFKNRIGICRSETNETIYWLEIIIESNIIKPEGIIYTHSEAKEFLAIFTSILNKL